MNVRVASVIASVEMESHHTSESGASSGGHLGHFLISLPFIAREPYQPHRKRNDQAEGSEVGHHFFAC